MDGAEAGQQPDCHRPFFALLPPEPAVAEIAMLRDGLGGLRGQVADSRLHITLLILDDLPDISPPLIGTLRAIGAAVAVAAPEIVLDRLACGPASAVLLPSGPQPALRTLHGALAAGLARVGLPMRAGFRFNPHVTLGYRPAEPGTRTIPPIRWRAEEVVLINSWVGLSRHERLGCWPLAGQPRLI